ncbi:MAG: SusC/RagA family TonB-linked outer membrane protein [Candidatus Cryptobacteroides sp.]
MILSPVAAAQEVAHFRGDGIVSGKVTDANGPVIGAAVYVKGSSEGSTTDFDGAFSIKAQKGDVIVVSIIGYETREIAYNGEQSLSIVLEESSTFLDEVVVTALGIKRSEKALSYNVQKVESEAINAVKDANFVNSLVGKVAGVQIQSGAAGPGSSTRVVMRGMKSIEKGNTALYVIDGIPMFNRNLDGGGGVFGGSTGSESAADINPEDIESISFLTGPSAAALYGSDAANGVILINTKKGSENRTSVTVNNVTTFSTVYKMPEMQSRYGKSVADYESWGEALDPSYSYDPRKFFNTGTNVMNSVSLSTGNSKNQTYLSASSTNSTGVMPESKYNRYNFSARHTTKFANDKLILDFSANFIYQTNHNLVSQGVYNNPIVGLYLFPRGENFDEVRSFERWNDARGIHMQYWPYGSGAHTIQNPYWVQHKMDRDTQKRRYMLNASLQYNITDWLNIIGRVRMDESNTKQNNKYAASTNTTLAGLNGGYRVETGNDRTIYTDAILNVDKSWNKFRLVANVGASLNDQTYYNVYMSGDLIVANHFAANNLDLESHFKRNERGYHDQTQSVFASVEASWNDALYLTLTGRNDWASQLAYSSHSSFFYPSVGLSAVISNLVSLPEWIPYLKVRGSYSMVASAFARFLSNPSLVFNEQTNTWGQNSTYPYRDLNPENTKSWEIGINARLFGGLSLDVTYYRSNTYNQTVYGSLPASSGYSNFIAQTGNVQNEGVELGVGYDNKWGNFSWGTNLTFTSNSNKVIDLGDDILNPITGEYNKITEIRKSWLGEANVAPQVIIREGGSLSDVYVNHFIRRDYNGAVSVDNNGNISMEEVAPVKVGSLSSKCNLGWTNNFGYKGLSLGVVVTARIGGLVYSGTQGVLDYYGVSEQSALAREGAPIKVNHGTISAKSYYQTISTAKGGHGAYYLYDATNVRLQELSLNYTLPKQWFNDKVGLTFGFVARNLAMIYCKAPFDPELSASTGSNYYNGVDYFMLPSTRNFGFNIKLQY